MRAALSAVAAFGLSISGRFGGPSGNDRAVPVFRGSIMSMIAGSLALSCNAGMSAPKLRPVPLSVITARLPHEKPAEEAAAELEKREGPPSFGPWLAHQDNQELEDAYDQEFPHYGVAFHMLAQVFAEPRTDSLVLGYLRRGSRFRAGAPVRGKGCEGRWYPVEGGGFACSGRGFVIGKSEKRFEPAPAPPDMYSALPYRYAKTLGEDVPQYFRLPTEQEERITAEAIAQLRAHRAANPPADEPALAKAPSAQMTEEQVGVSEERQFLPDFVRMTMRPGFYVSVDGIEETATGRRFVRTVRGAYVALDKLQEATVSPYAGVRIWNGLSHDHGLVHVAKTTTLRLGPSLDAYAPGPELLRFSAVELSGRREVINRKGYVETAAGLWVDERALRFVKRAARPTLVPKQGRWVDVDLTQQVLVAYQGDEPVYATLVATGKPGFDTPTGLFRIYAKHISTTMDGADGTDEVYSIEDVPFTMYFQGSLALHAAFWHDRFGRVRSHGCVNLAPRDARFLFEWSTPVRPPGFHGVQADPHKHSTYVSIRSS